jgi:hypothetical protein
MTSRCIIYAQQSMGRAAARGKGRQNDPSITIYYTSNLFSFFPLFLYSSTSIWLLEEGQDCNFNYNHCNYRHHFHRPVVSTYIGIEKYSFRHLRIYITHKVINKKLNVVYCGWCVFFVRHRQGKI